MVTLERVRDNIYNGRINAVTMFYVRFKSSSLYSKYKRKFNSLSDIDQLKYTLLSVPYEHTLHRYRVSSKYSPSVLAYMVIELNLFAMPHSEFVEFARKYLDLNLRNDIFDEILYKMRISEDSGCETTSIINRVNNYNILDYVDSMAEYINYYRSLGYILSNLEFFLSVSKIMDTTQNLVLDTKELNNFILYLVETTEKLSGDCKQITKRIESILHESDVNLSVDLNGLREEIVNKSNSNTLGFEYILDSVDKDSSLLNEIKSEFNLRDKDNKAEVLRLMQQDKDLREEVLSQFSIPNEAVITKEEDNRSTPSWEYMRFVYDEETKEFYLKSKYGRIVKDFTYPNFLIGDNDIVSFNGEKIIFNYGYLEDNLFRKDNYLLKMEDRKKYYIIGDKKLLLSKGRISADSFKHQSECFNLRFYLAESKVTDGQYVFRDIYTGEKCVKNVEAVALNTVIVFDKESKIVSTFDKLFYTRSSFYDKYKIVEVLRPHNNELFGKVLNSPETLRINPRGFSIDEGAIIKIDADNTFIEYCNGSYLETAPEYKRIKASRGKIDISDNATKIAVLCNPGFGRSLINGLAKANYDVTVIDGMETTNTVNLELNQCKPSVVVVCVDGVSHENMWAMKDSDYKVVYPRKSTTVEILEVLK